MSLRDKIEEVFVGHGSEWGDVTPVSSPTGALISDIVEVVAEWLECPDVRSTIYDGLVAPGPTTKNIGVALANRVRHGPKKEENDDGSE